LKENSDIIGSLVTMIQREKFLLAQVESLSFQVDILFITLNGFREVPKYLNKFKNVYAICDPYNFTKDVAKLIISEEIDSSYFFTFDDDIDYPPNYVKIYLEKFQEYGKKTILCTHGTILKPDWKIYYRDRKVIHYFEPLKEDRNFDLAGTATTAFHTSELKIKFNEIWDFNIGSDLWLAYFAFRKNLPLISLARPKNWIRCKPGSQNAGTPLFVKVAKDKDWQWRRNRFFRGWKLYDK